MKWKHPGHEYDHVYENICRKKRYYIFGAGDYGRHLRTILEKEFDLIAFIDNSEKKQGTVIDGLSCIPFSQVKKNEEIGIIMSVSQMQRGDIIVQLEQAGWKRNVDFFIIEEFLSVYYVYKYGRVYFLSISFLPSTACNLRCASCLNFNPYAKTFYIRSWEQIKSDIDAFFACVDHILLFHVSGGEPFLNRLLPDVIEYLDAQYGDRIDILRTVTNGTVVPSDELCARLAKTKVEVTVDDYRDAVPKYRENFPKLLDQFDKHHIPYTINKADEWIDLMPAKADFHDKDEAWMEQHFNACCQSWQELRAGKLYSCNYDAYATVAGIKPPQDDEVYDLTDFRPEKKKELVEFRLGYNKKGYTNLCRHCLGFGPMNTHKVAPAVQAEHGLSLREGEHV